MSGAALTVWPAALRLDQAAAYTGLSVEDFLRVCPIQPIDLADGRWLRIRLEEWVQSLPDDWSPATDKNDFRSKSRSGWVYVIGFGHYVKIGYTSNSVEERIVSLQTGSPETLVVYAAMRGPKSFEAHLHQRFTAYNTQGEWFRREGSLADWIDAGCPL